MNIYFSISNFVCDEKSKKKDENLGSFIRHNHLKTKGTHGFNLGKGGIIFPLLLLFSRISFGICKRPEFSGLE